MKKLIKVLLVSMAFLFLVACSNSGDDEAAADPANNNANNTGNNTENEEQEVVKLKVAFMPNYASLNTVVAGMKTGSFEKQGIEVELLEFADGPTIIAAMESGSIDIGYIGPGAHVLPIQGRADIFAFSQLGNADEVIGSKEKGVESIDDLKGKTIAVAGGTSSETILNLTLQEAGLSEDDIKRVDMDASAIVTAMISGSIDAAATWSPNTNAIKGEMGDDAVMLSNNARYADEFPSIASWVTSPGYAEDNPGVLERFTAGLYDAMDYRLDNLEEVAKWVAEETAVSEESVLEQIHDGDWTTAEELLEMIEDGTMEALYQKQAENFVEAERLTDDELVPVSDYVLFDIMTEAGK